MTDPMSSYRKVMADALGQLEDIGLTQMQLNYINTLIGNVVDTSIEVMQDQPKHIEEGDFPRIIFPIKP